MQNNFLMHENRMVALFDVHLPNESIKMSI